MVILGIDPGTATTGFGVIDVRNGGVQATGWGLIETDKKENPGERLLLISRKLRKIIREYKPNVISIEKLFFATNAKTAMRVGQAQGVMIYCGALSKIEVVEYAPGTIKKVITGNGRSDKKDVQKYIRKTLGNRVKSRAHGKTHFDNSADALAVALCHALKNKLVKTGGGGEKV